MIDMAEQPGKQETDYLEDLLVSNSYEFAAMFTILERKGLISRAEFLDEIKRLRTEVKPPVDPYPHVMRG